MQQPVAMPPWLARLDPLPLECDGMARLLAAVLSRSAVTYEVHVGALEIASLGRISLHHWISLAGGRLIDLRARMWLGADPAVPHGIFVPSDQVNYRSVGQLTGTDLALHPAVFQIMTGATLASLIPAAQEVVASLEGKATL